MKKVFITGATGNVGIELLKALQNMPNDLEIFVGVREEDNLSPKEIMDQVNRKATIVIEHIIQASDISHTMQHWHIYRKWNELFYFECYDAYMNGRSNVDPTDTWYQGELGFYDYYIIPLAKKLKECGAFGVSGSEYLQYAMSNRSEWQSRGKEIVEEMRKRVLAKHLTNELVEL